MSLPAETLPVAVALVRLGADAAEGKVNSVSDIARSLVGIGLQLVPRDELRLYLSEVGIAVGEHVADAAEEAKFGTLPTFLASPDEA